MPRRLTLPDTASIAHSGEGERLHAPSAARNADAICDLVAEHAPETGTALEIASGTGQHVVALAGRLPGLIWQPTDVDAARRASVDAWARVAGLGNIAPAGELDATASGWADKNGGKDLILLVNLLHLISEGEAKILISETARALAPDGQFILYGPFLRDGETTSEGDARFHTSLQAQDPEIGYKDDWDVIDWLHGAFLDLVQVMEMPANNLAFVARRPV
jgi:SAM-dependent methyltransferase